MTRAAPASLSLAPMFAAAAAAVVLTRAPDARGEDLIVSRPGAHPDYFVELEPEAIVLFGRALDDGPGSACAHRSR